MVSSGSKLTIVSIATLLLLQSAGATWYMAGSYEPDSAADDPLLMRSDPPGAATNLIYFNVVTGTASVVGGTFVNPNVGALETRVRAPTLESHIAMLGVWVDCNGDGYVGAASGAMREYHAAFLSDTTRCPPATGGPNAWPAGAHNYNGWVSELVPIGDASPLDRRTYRDDGAMIWGDYGRPDDPSLGGGTCPIAPQPRGTYQSTGGFVNYVDCLTGLMDRWNSVWYGQRLMGQDLPGLNDFGVDLGLDFEDPNDARGTWIDRPTFGTEDTANSPAYIYDCSAAPIRSGDILNDTPLGPTVPAAGHNVQTYAIAPRLGNTGTPAPLGDGATVPALVNHTVEGSVQDCDTSNDAGHDFYGAKIYVGETDFNRVEGANKREANFNFGFGAIQRGRVLAGQLPVAPGGSAGLNIGPSYSDWGPGVVTLTGPPTLRIDIVEGAAELPGASYLTFYAHVSAQTTDRGFRTPGGSGVYGKAQCGTNDSGIHNGWNCDATTWYRNPDGTPVPEPARPFARPGHAYEFRDVDCYDGGIGDSGVGVSTPHYGESPCTLT